MPEGVSGGAVAMLANELVYAGGTTWRNNVKRWLAETRWYDLAGDTWRAGPSLPEPLAYGASLQSDRSLEVLGGMNENGISPKCWRLSAGGRDWIASGALPEGSIFGKAAIVGGRAYLFGGCTDAELNHCSNSVLQRASSGAWEKVSELPHGAVAIAAIAVVRDQIYLFGGCSRDSSTGVRNRNEAYRFNPQTNQWTALRPIPAAARGIGAVAFGERSILLAGGYTDAPGGFSDAAYVYDTKTGQYTAIGPLPLRVMGMEMFARGETIWGTGGEDKNRSRSQRLIQGILRP